MKKKKTVPNYKKIAIILISAAAVAIILFVIYMRFIIPYERASRYTDTIAIRELIISAVEGLSKDVPIDYRTGDAYFPEAKLYLPASASSVPLLYQYYAAGDGIPQELRITSRYLVNAKTSVLHGTNTMDELFRAVPVLQSCSRGVLVQDKPFDNNLPAETVSVADGRTLYLQHEAECPELAETLQSLKNLKSY